MAKHIPFVYTASDAGLVCDVFSDSEIVRVSLESADKTVQRLPKSVAIWVDSGFDSVIQWQYVTDAWKTYFGQFAASDEVTKAEFWKKPNIQNTTVFVEAIMQRCVEAGISVKWISIPQLPVKDDATANKLNRALAEAAGRWHAKAKFKGKLILPIIIGSQKVTNKKTARNQKVALAKECMEKSGADGYWVVDATLCDQDGAGPFEKVRFPGLIAFHEELRDAISRPAFAIAGPYWGLNLVLWAKGLVEYPAIGVGRGYQYHLPGRRPQTGSVRLALPPLRRSVVVSPELKTELPKWLQKIPKQDSAFTELLEILRSLERYMEDRKFARGQLVNFYKEWFDIIASAAPPGRALALYQDLSNAYVLGRGLSPLPDTEKSARRPERVAQQLMMQCL